MSQETAHWLNTQTLIGHTDKRGHAWHYRAEHQGDEPNHYPGPVPVADVQRRLFGWQAQSRPVFVKVPCDLGQLDVAAGIDDDGVPFRYVEVPGRQAITREDGQDPDVLGIFAGGYVRHQYREWLLAQVSTIVSDELGIGSTGLLKRGGVAWVSFEVPETITTPEGVAFRPNLLAATSHDGSLPTTYARVVTNVVCDNTMSAALAEKDQRVKVRHSRHSRLRLGEARAALAIIHTIGDDFAAQVAELTRVEVSDTAWSAFLDAHAALPEGTTPSRARTIAEKKRETLGRLWTHDTRVAPWRGTAWGVVQAVNTYTHHEQTVRGMARAERNMLRAVEGGTDALDVATMTQLRKVLASA
jgi:phage/plasmid-like protein (TIGR03299 family)